MSRVLVTGATGFIGRHAVRALRARGLEIHAIGRAPPSEPGLSFHQADLMDAARVRAVVEEVRARHLLHLAWYSEPGLYWRSPLNLDWVAASLFLARVFHEAGGRRAVVAGTCAEYAWGPDTLREDAPCAPATLYGAAKDGLRRVLEAYAATTGLSLAWGRVFFLYGPGEKPGRLVSDAIRALSAGERFATSEGLQRRDFSHVADVAEAFAAILGSKAEGAINIGAGAARPVRDILLGIAAVTGGANRIDFGARPPVPNDPPRIEAKIGRLREEVGFTPRHSLASGLADAVAWWRERSEAPLA